MTVSVYPNYLYKEGMALTDLNLKTYDKIYPLFIQKYQSLVTDPNANILDKINQIVDYLNITGNLSNNVVTQWNNVMAWVMNDGLNTDVTNKINTMVSDGTFNTLFNQYLAPSLGDITKLNTNNKSDIVDALNETFGDVQVNTAAIGALPNLKTSVKSDLVSAINENQGNVANNAAQLGVVVNPAQNNGGIVFGQEYLSAFHKKIMAWNNTVNTTNFKMVFSGDSTTAGTGTSGSSFHLDQLLQNIAYNKGFPFFDVVNNGQSGMDTEHWNQTYVNNDLSANPDLLVLRWGINDPYYKHTDNTSLGDSSADSPTLDVQRRTAADFETSLRSGLTKVRASLPQNQLSIVLMTPNSISDDYNGRNEKWVESIIPAIKKAARDFQCCFINTYQLIQDSRNASDYMDSPYSDFRHIHPNDVMNLWISGVMGDVIFPSGLNKVSLNNVRNHWFTNGIKTGSETPSTFPFGISMHRVSGSGAPFNGGLITFKSADNVVYQLNVGYNADKQFARRIRVAGDTWGAWYKSQLTPTRPPLQNGWVDYLPTSGSQAEYYMTDENIVHMQGLIKNGTTTTGTLLFTLPVGFRPAVDRFFSVASNGAFGLITVSADGTVKIQSGSNVYLSLDNVSYLATQ